MLDAESSGGCSDGRRARPWLSTWETAMTEDAAPTSPANPEGVEAQRRGRDLPSRRYDADVERRLAHGLEAADSIQDHTLPTFARGELPHFAGERGTFLKCPYIEDVHDVRDAEVAIFGVPLDAGTTYRPGTRFGPRGIRRATNLFGTYSYELGVDLREPLKLADIGDVCTIPGNPENERCRVRAGTGTAARRCPLRRAAGHVVELRRQNARRDHRDAHDQWTRRDAASGPSPRRSTRSTSRRRTQG
jgi:Arginase family